MPKTRKQLAQTEMQRIFMEIEKVEARAKRIAVGSAVNELFELSPEYTGWFKANHRMVFTDRKEGRVEAPVDPPVRPKPDERGIMEHEAIMNRADLSAKALTIEAKTRNPKRISLANGIHYAKHVGLINGRPNIGHGIRIMKRAAESAARKVDRAYRK